MNTIPIFFASNDDAYLPYLDVSILSLVEHTSPENDYTITVLNTSFSEENKNRLRVHQKDNVKIEFFNITPLLDKIKDRLETTHFPLFAYYRLFIDTAFPQYDKAIYLDSDTIILNDIAKLYNIDIGDNLVGAVFEQHMDIGPIWENYVTQCIGIPLYDYFNSGVLLINLKEWRNIKLMDTFINMVKEYNFDCVAYDQDYLNVICYNRVYSLPNGWNKESLPRETQGPLNLVHFAIANKPWHYEDTINGEYFWKYAKQSQFYEDLLFGLKTYTDEDKKRDKDKAEFLVASLKKATDSKNTFKHLWFQK